MVSTILLTGTLVEALTGVIKADLLTMLLVSLASDTAAYWQAW